MMKMMKIMRRNCLGPGACRSTRRRRRRLDFVFMREREREGVSEGSCCCCLLLYLEVVVAACRREIEGRASISAASERTTTRLLSKPIESVPCRERPLLYFDLIFTCGDRAHTLISFNSHKEQRVKSTAKTRTGDRMFRCQLFGFRLASERCPSLRRLPLFPHLAPKRSSRSPPAPRARRGTSERASRDQN